MNKISLRVEVLSLKIFLLYFLILAQLASAQEITSSRQLMLDDVISLAREQSPDAQLARTQFTNSYWQYQIYKADYRPKLSLNGTFPNFNRSINPITLPDGSVSYTSQNLATYSGNLSLSQNIGPSGAVVSVNSGLQRLDVIGPGNKPSYLSTPVVFAIQQPLFYFNNMRWQLKIEPVRFTEAKRQYMEAIESVVIKAIDSYFDLYLAQIEHSIALKNKDNNDTLYKIAQGRYNLGKIAESELLQIELATLNSNTALAQAELDLKIKAFNLRTQLGIKDNSEIALIAPQAPPNVVIDPNIALDQARKNRKKIVEIERRLMEADRDVAQAKAEGRMKFNLLANYGLSKTTSDVKQAYSNTLDQQQVSMGIQAPIADWGRAKAMLKQAQSNRELVQNTIAQEVISFEQEVYLNVMQYTIQRKQLSVAAKADTIGTKRFDVAKKRYLIGKTDITSMNIALTEKDAASRAYVSAMKNCWDVYYNIRRITLFDFDKNTIINTDLNIVK